MNIIVELPTHLRVLANAEQQVHLDLHSPPTMAAVIDALELRFPMLCGTIRERETGRRRPLVRFFACGEDRSHDPLETPLPAAVADGTEPFIILGAIAGG